MMILASLTLLFSKELDVQISKVLITIFMIQSGIGSYLFSKSTNIPKIANQYHALQGFGLILYGVFIISIANSLEIFLIITTYFVLIFGIFEITFSFAVMNSKHLINIKIMASRIITGAINLLGGFVLLMVTLDNPLHGLIVASILLFLGGTSLVIFSRKI